MATVKRRVEVSVMGLPLSVRTERDDAWIHGLAAQVSRRLEELRRAAPRANAQQLAVLVALNLAEELQQEREKNAAVVDDAVAVTTAALARVREALDSIGGDDLDDVDDHAAEVRHVVVA